MSNKKSRLTKFFITKNIKFHPPIHVLQMSTKSGEIALDLQISCQNLINTDGAFSLTDPVVTAYSINPESKKREHQIGQTECLSNTLSPVFKKSIKISKSYLASTFTSQSTYIEFDVTDSDLIGNIDKSVGSVIINIEDLVKSSSNKYGAIYKLIQKIDKNIISTNQTITIITNDLRNSTLTLKLSGKKIKKMDLLSQSDPFLKILQPGTNLKTTERIKDDANPEWEEFEIPLEKIKINEVCMVYCYDSDGPDKQEYIGECSVNFGEILESSSLSCPVEIEFKHKMEVTGYLIVEKCAIL